MSGRVTAYKYRRKEYRTPWMLFLEPKEETTSKWCMLCWTLCAVSLDKKSISSHVQGQVPFIIEFSRTPQDWIMKVRFNEHRLSEALE